MPSLCFEGELALCFVQYLSILFCLVFFSCSNWLDSNSAQNLLLQSMGTHFMPHCKTTFFSTPTFYPSETNHYTLEWEYLPPLEHRYTNWLEPINSWLCFPYKTMLGWLIDEDPRVLKCPPEILTASIILKIRLAIEEPALYKRSVSLWHKIWENHPDDWLWIKNTKTLDNSEYKVREVV